jgi:hemerythrin-like metal-binding protein
MTASTTFQWSKAYSVGVAVLDEQHQVLVAALHDLDEALRRGAGLAVIDEILKRLVDYASLHFATEENFMVQYRYPAFHIHRHHHQKFRVALAGFLSDHQAGKSGVPVKVLLFVQQWLKQHVLKQDKLYTDFLHARGVH